MASKESSHDNEEEEKTQQGNDIDIVQKLSLEKLDTNEDAEKQKLDTDEDAEKQKLDTDEDAEKQKLDTDEGTEAESYDHHQKSKKKLTSSSVKQKKGQKQGKERSGTSKGIKHDSENEESPPIPTTKSLLSKRGSQGKLKRESKGNIHYASKLAARHSIVAFADDSIEDGDKDKSSGELRRFLKSVRRRSSAGGHRGSISLSSLPDHTYLDTLLEHQGLHKSHVSLPELDLDAFSSQDSSADSKHDLTYNLSESHVSMSRRMSDLPTSLSVSRSLISGLEVEHDSIELVDEPSVSYDIEPGQMSVSQVYER